MDRRVSLSATATGARTTKETIAAFVLIEKVGPNGERASRMAGAVLIVAGVAVAAAPRL